MFCNILIFLSSAYIPLNNYLVFNDVDGLYTHAFEAEKKVCRIFLFFFNCTIIFYFGGALLLPELTDSNLQENCTACSQVPQDLQFPPSAKLQEILEYLTENSSL